MNHELKIKTLWGVYHMINLNSNPTKTKRILKKAGVSMDECKKAYEMWNNMMDYAEKLNNK